VAFSTLILVWGAALSAARSENGWMEDRISGVRVWDPEPGGDQVISWSGGSIDGKASGSGTLVVFEEGKLAGRYTGTMVAGRVDGFGEVEWMEDGTRMSYRGFFQDGKPHGLGTVTYGDGSTLKTRFVNGEIGEYGAYRGANGERYDGELKDGRPDGQGLHVSEDGEVYEGNFRAGKRSGEGELLLPDGTAMKGHFENDRPNGLVRVELPDGGVFRGELQDGVANGEGVYTSPDGTIYRGRFIRDKPDGKFMVTQRDGTQSTEVWRTGEKILW